MSFHCEDMAKIFVEAAIQPVQGGWVCLVSIPSNNSANSTQDFPQHFSDLFMAQIGHDRSRGQVGGEGVQSGDERRHENSFGD